MDDLIDFPVSDTWLGYYYERGLTPRRPRRMDPCDEIIKELREIRKALEKSEGIEEKPILKPKSQKTQRKLEL